MDSGDEKMNNGNLRYDKYLDDGFAKKIAEYTPKKTGNGLDNLLAA